VSKENGHSRGPAKGQCRRNFGGATRNAWSRRGKGKARGEKKRMVDQKLPLFLKISDEKLGERDRKGEEGFGYFLGEA